MKFCRLGVVVLDNGIADNFDSILSSLTLLTTGLRNTLMTFLLLTASLRSVVTSVKVLICSDVVAIVSASVVGFILRLTLITLRFFVVVSTSFSLLSSSSLVDVEIVVSSSVSSTTFFNNRRITFFRRGFNVSSVLVVISSVESVLTFLCLNTFILFLMIFFSSDLTSSELSSLSVPPNV